MNAYTALGCLKGALDDGKEYQGLITVPYRNIEVVNCSYESPALSSAEMSMITYLTHYILFVCGTGNSGLSNYIGWPSKHPSTFAVAAYGWDGNRWGSSNYGPGTDIAAPGANIWSTDMIGHTNNGYNLGYQPGATTSSSGTSMAAPHVSAIAILVTCKYEPDYDPGLVRWRIESTLDAYPALSGFESLGITSRPSAFRALYLP